MNQSINECVQVVVRLLDYQEEVASATSSSAFVHGFLLFNTARVETVKRNVHG
jgi:hypothetical protein